MSIPYTGEQVTPIARVVHAANSALQALDGDPAPSLPWDAETPEIRASAIAGVRAALNGATPEELHETWVRKKAAAGWVRGPVKDPDAKTHPCMVPYRQLPPGQKVKDAVLQAVTVAMAPFITGDEDTWRLTPAGRERAEAEELRVLVWEMLNTMPASYQALAFAVRAGRLGVTDDAGHPLVAACMTGDGDRDLEAAEDAAFLAGAATLDGLEKP